MKNIGGWLAGIVVGCICQSAYGFVPAERWSTTAHGRTGPAGTPITLTWSFAPDGSRIIGEGSSNLLQFMDTNFGAGSGGEDLTQRPWFSFFEQSLDRWSQLSGVTYLYEPNDDGRTLGGARGQLGIRGDVRIAGTFIDGASGTLAYNGLPDDGDMVLDTGDADFFGNLTSNHRRFRNVIMHEAGHGLGLQHVESATHEFLLEPVINPSFDGPQLDDIRGVQWMYGDALEKTHGGLGNDSVELATDLGVLDFVEPIIVGSSANTLRVNPLQTDFVSISNEFDSDYFAVTVPEPALLDIHLTPLGGRFQQGVQGGVESFFDANALNDLRLEVVAADGFGSLAAADDAGAGELESITSLSIEEPGEYFLFVSGKSDDVQLYELQLAGEPLAPEIEIADLDLDGDVDGSDLLDLLVLLGQPSTDAGIEADLSRNGLIDRDDLDLLFAQYGLGQVSTAASQGIANGVGGIPEPKSMILLLVVLGMSIVGRGATRCKC